MRYAVALEQAREHLADLDGHGADQHGLTLLVPLDQVLDDRGVLLLRGREDVVVLVQPDHVGVGRDLHDLEGVDLAELVLLGLGRTGHAREDLVHAEVVLEGDRRERLVLLADRHLLLGLDRLVQALRVAPAVEDPAGELVDDEHLAALDDVLDVLAVESLGAQRLDEVVDEPAVRVLVEVVDVERALDLGDAALGDGDGTLLLVDLVILAGDESRDDARELTVGVRRGLGRAADDERRARLVDEDRVDLVHDAEVVAALHHVLATHGHVVAQVVEAELGVGAVGDVGVVLGAALLRRHVGLDDADLEAEEAVHLAHPLGVALGEVVVDGDQVSAVAGDAVEVHRHGGDERLALTGLHLGDVAVVEHDAAEHLDVEGAHAQRTLRRFAGHGEGLEQQVVEQLAVLVALSELGGLGAQLVVAEGRDPGLELGHPSGLFLERLEAPAFTGVQQLVDDLDHRGTTPGVSWLASPPIVAQPAARVVLSASGARKASPDARRGAAPRPLSLRPARSGRSGRRCDGRPRSSGWTPRW